MKTTGQASILLVGGLCGLLVGALILGAVARAVGEEGEAQRAADLAALAGARAMHAAYPGLFEPPQLRDRPNPAHVERARVPRPRRAGRRAHGRGERRGARNGGPANEAPLSGPAGEEPAVEVSFPDRGSFAPVRIRVIVRRGIGIERGGVRRTARVVARAEAELAPPGSAGMPAIGGGGYDGPFAYRQGKPMRPDVALAFDRMERAARADGVALLITSAYRSDAEQAVLWNRHPDPRWVAPPGTSLHRLATELDLGPDAAHTWLAANAERFHFVQRYQHEPWHYGYTLNAGSRPRPAAAGSPPAGDGDGAVPAFVPPRYAAALARAAQRWNVSATLLAAQLYAESNFNPFAQSAAGAQGIAQFMPQTAAALGLENPFDAEQAIDAQAHLMRDLLRRFAAVPLALAAYNAGPAPVQACGCVPPYPETRAYVARILGLMAGAGEPLTAAGAGLVVRLVRVSRHGRGPPTVALVLIAALPDPTQPTFVLLAGGLGALVGATIGRLRR